MSGWLETASIGLAVVALIYRATIYHSLPVADGEPYGVGDVIDFGFAMLLFFVCGLCAASAVGLSMNSTGSEQRAAFRPAVVGITSFVVYFFVHPYVPRLM